MNVKGLPGNLEITALGFDLTITPFFGPIWNESGSLVALEMLSRIKIRGSNIYVQPEVFFKKLDKNNKKNVLSWQLDVVSEIYDWFVENNVLLSININKNMADMILSSVLFSERITKVKSILRLEINEFFFAKDSNLANDTLLKRLYDLTPLWLDDFGCGSTSLRWFTELKFEVVKVDKDLVRALSNTKSGVEFLKGLVLLAADKSTNVILEGVSDEKILEFARHSGVYAFQGWIWPETDWEGLSKSPIKFPFN